jgi:hypothetical protein
MSANRTILCLGHRHYLLPASANINLLLKAFSGAVELDDQYHDGEYFYRPLKQVKIEIKFVDPRFVLDGKRKMIPERCGPESMEEML